MTIVVQEVASPSWPRDELSPYVDWWLASDSNSGVREMAFPGLNLLGFGAAAGSPPRFIPLGPGSALAGRARRRVPIWQQALPPEDRPVGGLAQPGAVLHQPSGTFGAPLVPWRHRPPAVMVVIDTDLNPVHEQVLDGAGAPRILAHWLMEGAWRPDDRVPFGRENRQAEMAAAMAGQTEDAALRALGVAEFGLAAAPRGAAQGRAHGTHVLALAAGTDPADCSAAAQAMRRVPILAVSLPSNRLLSASGVFLDAFVDQALEWVSARLSDLWGPDWPPVVVNLSYGLAAGPKDGSGYLNTRLRGWLQDHPAAVLLMPAGNDGLADGHAVLDPGTGRGTIGWLVPPSDPFSTHAELWPLGDGARGAMLHLTPPGQAAALEVPVAPGRVFDLVDDTAPGDGLAGRIYGLPGGTADKPAGCLICLAATRPRRADAASAPAGLWTVAVSGAPGLRAALHLQSERSLTPHSRAGHPSRLVALTGAGARPQQAGTLNAIGPGTGAIIVNGLGGPGAAPDRPACQPADLHGADLSPPSALARWTSRGDKDARPPLDDGLAFPADRSRSLPGLLAPGYRSGATAVVEGTSFSTALAARERLEAALAAVSGP